jgi:hypothetical protein
MNPWIGIDLDGTLAIHDTSIDYDHRRVGAPIPRMVERVKGLIAQGFKVKIFTARVFHFGMDPTASKQTIHEEAERYAEVCEARAAIEQWCLEHLGTKLEVTCCKDYGMLYCIDDRARQCVMNTGILLEELRNIMVEEKTTSAVAAG